MGNCSSWVNEFEVWQAVVMADWGAALTCSPSTGAPFNVERLKADDLKAGVVKTSWLPSVEHSGTQSEQMLAFISMLTAGMLLGTSSGALNVSDEWNRVFPEYHFTPADEFLAKAWMGKP